MKRRHHCRRCGRIFCESCSSRSQLLPQYDAPVRVCDDCFQEENYLRLNRFLKLSSEVTTAASGTPDPKLSHNVTEGCSSEVPDLSSRSMRHGQSSSRAQDEHAKDVHETGSSRMEQDLLAAVHRRHMVGSPHQDRDFSTPRGFDEVDVGVLELLAEEESDEDELQSTMGDGRTRAGSQSEHTPKSQIMTSWQHSEGRMHETNPGASVTGSITLAAGPMMPPMPPTRGDGVPTRQSDISINPTASPDSLPVFVQHQPEHSDAR